MVYPIVAMFLNGLCPKVAMFVHGLLCVSAQPAPQQPIEAVSQPTAKARCAGLRRTTSVGFLLLHL